MTDLPYPPGDSALVRAGATNVRTTLDRLRVARTAAAHLQRIGEGAHWRGDAFEAFRAASEVKPLPQAIDRAGERMTQAADHLDWFADRFDETVATIRWCRARLAALGIDGGPVPDELVPEVQRIRWDAERALDDHEAAVRSVADLFDWLDDEPTFATPPPSNWDRARGAVGHVWSFGVGVVEGGWEMVEFSAELTIWLNPLTGPLKWHDAMENRGQILDVVRFAWDHPGEFAGELGKAVVDLETLREDGVARWLGHRVPEVAVVLASGGLGAVGTVRGVRAASSALRRVVPRLEALVELGTFARADVRIARLAEEIPAVARLTPTTQRRLDSLVVNGVTGQLVFYDALDIEVDR